MNYPFEYKEVEKNLADVAPRPYDSEGMRFVKFIYIKVSDVIHDFKNPARANAILGGDVTKIENIIKAGLYDGWRFVPPVVNKKGELIAGHHRLEGHIGKDEEYMWVALCAFDDRVAEYDYSGLENQIEDTFEKNVSTNEDLISYTLNGISEGLIKLEDLEKKVKGYIKRPEDKRIILEEVKRDLGIKIDAHRTLPRGKIDSEFSSQTNGAFYDLQASISIGDNIWNNGRLLKGVGEAISSGKDCSVILKIKDTSDLKELNKERERLIKEMNAKFLYEKAKEIVDSYENGTMGSVTLNFPRQYESDSWKIDVETSND